jgi:hypothetical protein
MLGGMVGMEVDWTTNYNAVEQQDYTTESFMGDNFVYFLHYVVCSTFGT